MKQQLLDSKYDFICGEDKAFIIAFDQTIKEIGYGSGGSIGNGYCWGRYMIIYSKTGVKDKRVAARIYIRDNGIILRLFFSNIDKHRTYLENASDFIRLPFIDQHGNCKHCHNEKEGLCKFRKTYTIHNRMIEKCNGFVFEFENPNIHKLPNYMGLLKEFYPVRKGGKA